MSDWYILSDIPYQKEFPPTYKNLTPPARPYAWNILNDIPYRKSFVPMYELDNPPPILYDWYILTNIPYRKQFVELLKITHTPDYPKIWYILENIPYIKTYVEMLGMSIKPDYPRIWYILNNIPYIKDYPELLKLSAKPDYPRIWWIDTNIPYIKEYPDIIGLSQKPPYPRIWYILNDIPYLKEYPPMYHMEPQPVPVDWYILYDIPYRKEYPPMYELDSIPVPTELQYYVVGIAAVGRWQIRRWVASIPDEWTLIEDLGPPSAVLSACIEADGDFDYIAGNDSITLTTTDTPWMAVITTTKKLYVKQVCADITTAILLDTGVEQASLCRGWKSDKYSVDSGLICAYRKANGVYAKVYKKVNGEYVWETLPQLLYEPVDHVEVKRLNDYRIGVYVTNPNRLLLSERFYIGGTSKTEYVYTEMKSWGHFCAFATTNESYTSFQILSATIEDNTTIRIHGNYSFADFDPDFNDIVFTDDYKYSSMVGRAVDNGDLLIYVDKPRVNTWTMWRIQINTLNRIRYQITPQLKFLVAGQTITVGGYAYDEHVSVTMQSDINVFRTTMKQDYSHTQLPEYVNVSLVSDIGVFHTTMKQDLVHTCETESVYVTMNSNISEFVTTQSGDLPI